MQSRPLCGFMCDVNTNMLRTRMISCATPTLNPFHNDIKDVYTSADALRAISITGINKPFVNFLATVVTGVMVTGLVVVTRRQLQHSLDDVVRTSPW